jgi:hypothetical protein
LNDSWFLTKQIIISAATANQQFMFLCLSVLFFRRFKDIPWAQTFLSLYFSFLLKTFCL